MFGMGSKDHVSCSVKNDIVGVCYNVVNYLPHRCVGCFGGSRLLLSKFIEGDDDFVVHFESVVEGGFNNPLDTSDSFG